ncbi:MAG TPA: Stk1 family PASTA domain-containing Ser/Thr kinase [Propionibacteriaceae bacterium]
MAGDDRVLGGRYELGPGLGRGGMAEVRRGNDLRLGRPVAVKLLSAELAADPVFRTRFQREAQSAASLNHPCIVAVFDTGEEADPVTGASLPYIVMELVEGQTLRAVLTGGHQLPVQRALEVAQGVLDALGHSHHAGIIHRDIKPANVMLTPSGGVKVMDFGIARAVADTSTDLTQTAAVIGTAQYLSPEQARGERVDLRTDIYSTGCLLFELLVGRAPFVGESAISVVYQHVREEPDPPSRHNPLIHPQVDAIVLKALAKDPADRYQSASAMSDDIGRVLAGERATATEALAPAATAQAAATATLPAVLPVGPPPAEPLPVRDEDAAPRKRRPGLVLLVGALVLLLLGAGVYGLLRGRDGRAPAATVAVPNVMSQSRSNAETTLRNASLTPQIVEVSGKDDDSVGTVVQQKPIAGQDVQTDSVVILEVNSGSERASVPTGLTGLEVDDAERLLEKAGFDKVRTEKDEDPPGGADQDDVLSVNPKEGTSARLDDQITLTYAEVKESEEPQSPSASDPSPTETPSETSRPADPSTSAAPTTTKPTTTDEPTKSPTQKDTKKPSESAKPNKADQDQSDDEKSGKDPSNGEKANKDQLDAASSTDDDDAVQPTP